MVNKKIWLGVLVMVLVFAMVSCKQAGGPTFLEEGKALTGKMSVRDYDFLAPVTGGNYYTYTNDYKDGAKTITSSVAAIEGEIKANGDLTITLGKPTISETTPINTLVKSYLEGEWDEVTVSSTTAKCAIIESFSASGSIYPLNRQNYSVKYGVSGNTFTCKATLEKLIYLYVDSDVTITGKGKTFENISITFGKGTGKTTNLNLKLREGWNMIYTKYVLDDKTGGGGTTTII